MSQSSPDFTSDRVQHPTVILADTHLCCGFYTWCPNSVCPLCVHTGTGSGKSFMCATVTGSHWRAGGRLLIYISDFVSVRLSRGSSLSLVTIRFVIIYYNVSGLHQPDGWEALRWVSAQTHKTFTDVIQVSGNKATDGSSSWRTHEELMNYQLWMTAQTSETGRVQLLLEWP